jgi:hypothetical protein
MEALRLALYSLALIASLGCTVLLIRGYRQRQYPLLLWSAVCFACLTVNNMLLFVDLILFPDIDLRVWRLTAALIGILCLLYAFIGEAE